MSIGELAGIPDGWHDTFCEWGGMEWSSHVKDADGWSQCNLAIHSTNGTEDAGEPGEGEGVGVIPTSINHGQWYDYNVQRPMCFWDGRNDPTRNEQRMASLVAAFGRKYPEIEPFDLPSPACGW